MSKNLFLLTLLIIGLIIPTQTFANQYDADFEFGIYTGFLFGEIDGSNDSPNYDVHPLYLELGWKLNDKIGLSDHKGVLRFVWEPVANIITNPDQGVEVGSVFNTKYSYPIFDNMTAFVSAGAGPIYLSIDTYEQGSAGFNFIDQGSAGVQYFISDDKSINLTYKFRHISNAGIGGGPNAGYNTQGVTAGISLYY